MQVVEDTSSGCGTNYSVIIVSDDFEGKNTLARHKLGNCIQIYRPAANLVLELMVNARIVHEVLSAQIAEMHAFSQVGRIPRQAYNCL